MTSNLEESHASSGKQGEQRSCLPNDGEEEESSGGGFSFTSSNVPNALQQQQQQQPPSSLVLSPVNLGNPMTSSKVDGFRRLNFPYEKLERVGKGSFGEVYKGINLKSQDIVAIKIVDLDVDYEPEEFQAELALLAQCSCDYVVKYYGAFLRGTQLWMIMDYCGGGSIREALKLGPLSESTIAMLARDILRALVYLHKSNIIHRDIKAANVLLTDSGHVKLCDFGVAGQVSLTSAKRNTFVGTPYWMAPEVILHSNYDFKADIWSFGITIYEMAVGDPPYAEKDPLQALFIISKTPPAKLEGKFSSELKEFISLCLHDDPNERPSAEELLRSRFIRSAKKGTSQLKALVEKLKKLKERQKAEENEPFIMISRPSIPAQVDSAHENESLRETTKKFTKSDKQSARFSRDDWDFSMRTHQQSSFHRSTDSDGKPKRIVDVSKIKARPIKTIESQKRSSSDHDRHASKGIIVIPSEEGTEPIKKPFQDGDFREVTTSSLFGEHSSDEKPVVLNNSSSGTLAAIVSQEKSPPDTRIKKDTIESPAGVQADLSSHQATKSSILNRLVSQRSNPLGNPLGLMSLSSRNEPRFTKSDSIKFRKERRRERNASYQSLASLETTSHNLSLNPLPKATLTSGFSVTPTQSNVLWNQSRHSSSQRSTTIGELLNTPSELPPLCLDTFLQMESTEVKETLGTATAQAYRLLCELGDQMNFLEL